MDQKKENANLLEQIAYYKLAITEVKDDEDGGADPNNNSKSLLSSGIQKGMQGSFTGGSTSMKKLKPSFAGAKSGYQSAYPISGGAGAVATADALERYKGVVEKLKATLEGEKKKLKQARMQYAKEMQAKTELEELLFQCVEEVRNEAAAANRKTTDKFVMTSSSVSGISFFREKKKPHKFTQNR